MKNVDKIRSMTDEELAQFLEDWVEPCYLCAYKDKENNTCGDCKEGRLLWLQSKYNEKYF